MKRRFKLATTIVAMTMTLMLMVFGVFAANNDASFGANLTFKVSDQIELRVDVSITGTAAETGSTLPQDGSYTFGKDGWSDGFETSSAADYIVDSTFSDITLMFTITNMWYAPVDIQCVIDDGAAPTWMGADLLISELDVNGLVEGVKRAEFVTFTITIYMQTDVLDSMTAEELADAVATGQLIQINFTIGPAA